LPLSPATLHILLALAYRLGPGTLYDNLQKLMDRGLVKEGKGRAGREDPPRRYYRLTDFGRRVLSADLVRLKSVLREARLHLRAAESGKAS